MDQTYELVIWGSAVRVQFKLDGTIKSESVYTHVLEFTDTYVELWSESRTPRKLQYSSIENVADKAAAIVLLSWTKY